MAKQHAWVTEEVDGSNAGIGVFWICSECGASGGPAEAGTPQWPPFLAGWGLSTGNLSEDCDEAKEQIAQLRLERKILNAISVLKQKAERDLTVTLIDEDPPPYCSGELGVPEGPHQCRLALRHKDGSWDILTPEGEMRHISDANLDWMKKL